MIESISLSLFNGLNLIKILYYGKLPDLYWSNKQIYIYILDIINIVNKINSIYVSNKALNIFLNYSFMIMKEYIIKLKIFIKDIQECLPLLSYDNLNKTQLELKIYRKNKIKFYVVFEDIHKNFIKYNYLEETRKEYLKQLNIDIKDNPWYFWINRRGKKPIYLTENEAYNLMNNKKKTIYIKDKFDIFKDLNNYHIFIKLN